MDHSRWASRDWNVGMTLKNAVPRGRSRAHHNDPPRHSEAVGKDTMEESGMHHCKWGPELTPVG